jgi:hypothetical protein
MRPVLAFLLLALAACGVFDGGDGQLETLLRNRMRWESLQLRDYDFDFQRMCYCGAESVEPVRVEVRNALVSRVVTLRTGADVTHQQYTSWPTVDSLFAWTERDFGHDYDLTISYDQNFRFPARVEGDIPLVVDDEFTRTANNLVRR